MKMNLLYMESVPVYLKCKVNLLSTCAFFTFSWRSLCTLKYNSSTTLHCCCNRQTTYTVLWFSWVKHCKNFTSSMTFVRSVWFQLEIYQATPHLMLLSTWPCSCCTKPFYVYLNLLRMLTGNVWRWRCSDKHEFVKKTFFTVFLFLIYKMCTHEFHTYVQRGWKWIWWS